MPENRDPSVEVDIVGGPISRHEYQELKRAAQTNHWERVLFYAADGQIGSARQLRDQLLKRAHPDMFDDTEKIKREAAAKQQEDPWEAVLYLAHVGEVDAARELLSSLLAQIKQQLDQLQAGPPTIMQGILYRAPDENGRVVVGAGGGRFEVEVRIDPKPSDEEFVPGREVWVDRETFAVVRLENTFVTLIDGVLLGAVDEDRYLVGVAGQRMEVDMWTMPRPDDKELIPGREVWVDQQTYDIFKLRDTYVQGETADVLEVLEDDEDLLPERATRTLKLKISTGQGENIIEGLPGLRDEEIGVGDKVRILPGLGIAVELLEHGNKELFLGELPDVTYDDIGGLEKEIEQIYEAIEAPYIFANIFRRYRLERPKGILLHGPPGCGKTMIAKAIANSLSKNIERSLNENRVAIKLLMHLNAGKSVDDEEIADEYSEWRQIAAATPPNDQIGDAALHHILGYFLQSRGISLDRLSSELKRIEAALREGAKSYFISIKGPELLSKWVGEAESNIRSVFVSARERASDFTPVVLFFDELESMFSRRGSGISSDIQKTIVPQLLAEIDGVEEARNLVVIGATNRLDLVDPAVQRPGRMDFKIEIPRPDREGARAILTRYLTPDVPFATRALRLSPDVEEALGGLDRIRTVLPDYSPETWQVADAVMPHNLEQVVVGALESLESRIPGARMTLWLNEFYRMPQDTRRTPQELDVCAQVGFAPDAKPEEREVSKDASWVVVRQNTRQLDQSLDGSFQTAIWPLCAFYDPQRVWGALTLEYVVDVPDALVDYIEAHWLPMIAAVIQARRIETERLTHLMLDLLYHPNSRIEIIELAKTEGQKQQRPLSLSKPLKEILSGAMLDNIVARAKRYAVNAEMAYLESRNGRPSSRGNDAEEKLDQLGVSWQMLRKAIQKECDESKNQYIAELEAGRPAYERRGYMDSEQYQIDVILAEDADLSEVDWLITNFAKKFDWRRKTGWVPVREAGQS